MKVSGGVTYGNTNVCGLKYIERGREDPSHLSDRTGGEHTGTPVPSGVFTNVGGDGSDGRSPVARKSVVGRGTVEDTHSTRRAQMTSAVTRKGPRRDLKSVLRALQ